MSILLNNLVFQGILVIPVVYLITFLFKFYRDRYILSKIPMPKGHVFLGNLWTVLSIDTEDLFDFLRDCSKKHWPIYRFQTPYITTINFLRPEDLEIILSGMKHLEKSKIYVFLSNWLGEGLLTSKGEKWHTRRKILTPAFHFDMLHKFLNVFYEETEKLVELFEIESQHSSDINVVPFISQMTLQTIGETAMGLRNIDKSEQTEYKQSIYRLAKILLMRVTKPWYRIPIIYKASKVGREENVLVKKLHNFAYKVIGEREKTLETSSNSNRNNDVSHSGRKRLALLDLLLTAKNNGENIDYEGIREEVDTFMFEGHDTTSAAISFLLHSLAFHESIQDKVFEEIQEVLGSKSKIPTYNDLQELKYMERVIKETLRLYPSVPFISRLASEDFVTYDGYKIPKGSVLHVHIFDLHRDPEIYPDPLKFDPDRFLPENCKDRHPFAYLPFSAGPRNCIGQRFAIFELKSVLCGVLRRFHLKPAGNNEMRFSPDLVLRTVNDITIKFVRRV